MNYHKKTNPERLYKEGCDLIHSLDVLTKIFTESKIIHRKKR